MVVKYALINMYKSYMLMVNQMGNTEHNICILEVDRMKFDGSVQVVTMERY